MKKIKAAALSALTAISLACSGAPAAPAQTAAPEGTVKPWDAPADPPRITRTGQVQEWVNQVDHKNVLSYKVFSPSMRRDIPVAVIPATDQAGNRVPNAPTLYLLNGAGGAEQNQDWLKLYPAKDFFAGKRVNVVVPQAGAFSYYTDWVDENVHSDYINGPQKWETFLTKELPGPIERVVGANGRRAVAGVSMSATSALLLPQHNPGMYQAAAAFSGCAATSSPHGYNFARVTVNRASATPDFKTVTPEKMWGPMNSPYNRYNDALLGAEKLRGTKLYISSGTGLAGRPDQVSYLMGIGAPQIAAQAGSAVLQVEGGVIEAAVNTCTHDLKAKLDGLGIPAHFELRNAGTHSWPYWTEDMNRAWTTTIAPALGV
ncbi:alpha/beta hydrolase [Corynebacterium fournieri]|uniref:alpha/beta hydrolase n=1 Tax=Corynebacterium fournieri TaxID=1852390 RepID=UPI0025B56ADD|nr:alpha/beta hydrolase family protein [Corynebacterium fournieri]WJY96633.1 Diacylglycerol acyltransferase/mycolyltransferase Ag85A precursor [Corynebacterium fournieri]